MADINTPTEAYGKLDQAQRTQLAQEFVAKLGAEHDSQAQHYAQMDLSTISAAQLAEMHDHIAHHHPGVFGEVMKHPILTAALAGFATYEVEKHLRDR